MIKLEEIERLAREATPGLYDDEWLYSVLRFGHKNQSEFKFWTEGLNYPEGKDAKYIASVSPDVVLKMIERLRAADELVKAIELHVNHEYRDSWFHIDSCIACRLEKHTKKYRQLSEEK